MVSNKDSGAIWDVVANGRGTHKGECIMCLATEHLNINSICKPCWTHYKLDGVIRPDVSPKSNEDSKLMPEVKGEAKEEKDDKAKGEKVDKYILVDVEDEMIPEIISLHKLTYPAEIPDDHYEKLLKEFKEKKAPFIVALNEHHAMVGFVACRIKTTPAKTKWDMQLKQNMVSVPAETNIMLSAIASFEGYKDSEVALISEVIKESKKLKATKIITHVRGQHKEFRSFLEQLKFKGVRAGSYRDKDEKFEYTYTLVKSKSKGKKGVKTNTDTSKSKVKPKPKPKPKPKSGWFKIIRVESKHNSQIMAIHNKTMTKQRKITYFDKLAESTNRLVWVAVDSNGDVVGYIAGRQGRMIGLDKGPKDRINLVGMAVKGDWRRLGIADKLWRIFVSSCRYIKDAKFIYGHVRESNFEASNLYQKIGFKRKRIGKYDDTDEYKYIIIYRLKYINLTPYYLKYKKPIHTLGFVGLGYALNEIVDKIVD